MQNDYFDLAPALHHFQEGEWFEAHEVLEVLEVLWKHAAGANRVALQALIQSAVCLEHLKRGNRRSAWGQYQKALTKLSALPSSWNGIQLEVFARDLREFALQIDLGSDTTEPKLPDPTQWPIPMPE